MSPEKANKRHINGVIIVERQLIVTMTSRGVARVPHVTKVGKSMFVSATLVTD
jgi:hypothetical protein